uniref:Uncharacterized protein n=1 Tax=viral metagenome TaxID=1070528 RepID=A0A6H1ZRK1_9ZZZZ
MKGLKKYWLSLAIALFSLFLISGAFSLVSITVINEPNVTYPNNTEWYSRSPFPINITTDATGAEEWNVSVYVDGIQLFWMDNVTATEAWNTSAIVWNATGPSSPDRNLQLAVYNSTGSISWNNATVFRINEYSAGAISITPVNLANGTEYYDLTNDYNATLNETGLSSCTGYTDSTYTTLVSMINNSGVRTQYWNASEVIKPSNNGAWRYITWKCEDAFGNQSWYNSTAGAGLLWKINEKAPQSVNITSDNTLTNGTIYDAFPGFNITLNDSLAYCDYYFNETVTSMSNSSGVRTEYINSSVFTPAESPYDEWHNVTYKCQDAFGNVSEYIRIASNYTYIKVDRTNPTVANEIVTIENATTGGNYLNFTFNTSDRNPDIYWIREYHDAITSTIASTLKYGTENRWVETNLTNTTITVDGKYFFEANARDDVNRNGTSSANQTYLASYLESGEWNQVVFNENITLANIASKVPDITHVAIYNNLISYKNFTTHTVGTATYADIQINSSLNATYIKTNEDVLLIRPYYNFYETANITLWTGGWNFIGMVNKKSLNTTMFADVYSNATVGAGDSNNVTYASWFNSTAGLFCTGRRGFSATSCPGFDSTDIYGKEDDGLWILSNHNLTMNRSAM